MEEESAQRDHAERLLNDIGATIDRFQAFLAQNHVVEQMIADGMKKERFLQITGYKASTYEKKAREGNVPVGKSGLLSEICAEFGLKPDVAIKEQWF